MSPNRLLTIVSMTLLAAFACAQATTESSMTPEEIILGTTSPDLLLRRGDVRDDLQLTSDQSIKILTIQNSVQDQTEKIKAPAAEGESDNETSFEAIRRYAIEQVDQVLTPDQMKRLKQIALQLTGYSALARGDVQKQIELPKDIELKVFDLAAEEHRADESVVDKFEDGDLTAEQIPEIIKKNRQILNLEIEKILPQAVKDKFKALGGRPFKPSTSI